MEISEFTLKLIIIIIPGAIASIIYEKLTIHKKWSPFAFISNSILMGGLSYLLCQMVFSMCGDHSFDSFWDNLPAKEIPYPSVMKAIGASIIVGFLGSGMDRFKLIQKIGAKARVSTKYGDENLYTYFLGNEEINEIYIRDTSTNQTYHGMIVSFSETQEFKEIVLRDSKVYNYETSEYLYDAQYVYLTRPKDALTIEVFPVAIH